MFGKAKTSLSERPIFGMPQGMGGMQPQGFGGTNYGNMWGQLQNPYAKPVNMKPLPKGAESLAGTPWGNFMQSPESFGGQFDNMQTLPWLMNHMRQQWGNRGSR